MKDKDFTQINSIKMPGDPDSYLSKKDLIIWLQANALNANKNDSEACKILANELSRLY